MSVPSRALLRISAISMMVFACDRPTAPQAQVRFVLDAPLCSSVMPVEFFVDGMTVGQDTFRVHLAPEHTVSRVFTVSTGAHILGARTTGAFAYAWPDAHVTASPTATTTDTLPFYCS